MRFASMKLIKVMFLVLSFGGGSIAGAADFQKGMEAYNNGDYETAFQELQPLAKQGDADAQFKLGRMYRKGEGVPQDDAQAVAWYRKAAEQGVADAQSYLGFMYESGQGVPEDGTQAVTWHRKAAEQGYVEAQWDLGFAYANGLGVPQDYAEAVAWYRKAAEQDYVRAQFSLGARYANGQGVPQDYVQAHMWYNLSASQGREAAARNLNTLAERMTPQQISEAQALAREWVSNNR